MQSCPDFYTTVKNVVYASPPKHIFTLKAEWVLYLTISKAGSHQNTRYKAECTLYLGISKAVTKTHATRLNVRCI